MLFFLIALAQANPVMPLPGVAGWISAGTGIGLLGGVLYWLCWHHIPTILKNHKETIDGLVSQHGDSMKEKNDQLAAKDVQIMQILKDKDAVAAQLVKDFKEEMRESRVIVKDTNQVQKTVVQEMGAAFKQAIEAERHECTRRMAEMAAQWREEREEENRGRKHEPR
jgi:F0F1-type ATP synthase membrane subunit b/b'